MHISGLALVLGGGGPIGIAWETGLIVGLADAGVDLGLADCIIGTSAGSIVGANLALTHSLEALYHQQSTPFEGEDHTPPDMGRFMAAWTKAKLFHRSLDGIRRSLGKSAVAASVGGSSAWLAGIRRRLPGDQWPSREFKADLRITAIDVNDGRLLYWDKNSGVPLTAAVAASCAVPCVFPLAEIGGRLYMDGGMGSPTNAHLASGFADVIVADPLGRIPGISSLLQKEVEDLERQGSRVQVFLPDDAVTELIGYDLMDPSKCAPVAALARQQGRRAAALHQLNSLRN